MAVGVNLRTTNDLPIDATNPLQVATVGGTGAAAQQVQGTGASGAAVVGNPVGVGLEFNTTLPTVTTGQRVAAQADSRGNIRALSVMGNTTGGDGISNANMVTPTNFGAQPAGSLTFQPVGGMKFNGTTWDRDRKPNASSRIVSAAATTNATLAKASAGDLHITSGNNINAAIRYLKIYNKATAPVVGTDVPVITMALEPLKSFHVDWGGQYFSAGIAYALTTGAADADTGALTAGDILGLSITYA